MYLILTKGKLKHTMGKGPYFMLQSPHAPCGNNTNCYEKKFKYLTTDYYLRFNLKLNIIQSIHLSQLLRQKYEVLRTLVFVFNHYIVI